MTAPDDLARTLAEHRAVLVWIAGLPTVGCRCSGENGDYNAHLASVLSRRADIRTPDVLTDGGRPTVLDTDLRTRIEALRDDLLARNGGPFWATNDLTRALVESARALDGDTREDVETSGLRDESDFVHTQRQHPHGCGCPRSPADTDTGHGQ
ncbi:MAG TPA: hypothetical protein VMT27_07690 [Actinomycetes bacterium]|nr:hypothetical protein [Actinomycetes bacterium]